METGLETIVKLVGYGAAGTAVACMLISAYLLYGVIRQRDASGARVAEIPELTVRVGAVKSFMIFSAICLMLGLLMQLAPSILTPKVHVVFKVEPADMPEGLSNLRPTIKTLENGKTIEKDGDTVTLMTSDKDLVTCSYTRLLERYRGLIRGELVVQGRQSDAGP